MIRIYNQHRVLPHIVLIFLEKNYEEDNWYLHIEYFDPHEPYFVPEKYKKMYTEQEAPFDWPFYGEVEEGGKEVDFQGIPVQHNRFLHGDDFPPAPYNSG